MTMAPRLMSASWVIHCGWPVLASSAMVRPSRVLKKRAPSAYAAPRLTRSQQATPFAAQLAWPGLALFPGLPATSVPVGRTDAGLPIGVQVIADRLHDHTAIAVAKAAHDLMRTTP